MTGLIRLSCPRCSCRWEGSARPGGREQCTSCGHTWAWPDATTVTFSRIEMEIDGVPVPSMTALGFEPEGGSE